MDGIVAKHVRDFQPAQLLRDIRRGKCEACGALPMAAVMMASKKMGAGKAIVLNMANSGDVSGDYSGAVGYMSAIMVQDGDGGDSADNSGSQAVGIDLGLNDREKDVLRNVVSSTLESVVNGGSIPQFDNHEGKLGEHWGAFVTLNKHGRLRGCIGHIIGTQPLIDTVAEMSRAAALEDPRFPSVKPEELTEIEFEISVLTPIRKISDVNEIHVGRDGIIITRGYNRGLLLPQVATEYGWDRETFLEHTCQKAGLPRDAWKDPQTTIEMFSAEVFH
jgi:hypothetical protein